MGHNHQPTATFHAVQTQTIAALLAVNGIGRKTVRRVMRVCDELGFGLDEFWCDSTHLLWQKAGLNVAQQEALLEFQQQWTPESYYGWVMSQHIRIIGVENKLYPKLLKNIDDYPLILYIKGEFSAKQSTRIAVVGTRQISGYGRAVVKEIVPQLVAAGCSIVSGFMYGVDVTAQKAAAAVGGYGVGVLGGGFQHVYPPKHSAILDEMVLQGHGFVSEYPPWTSARRHQFPERNRIVAGMTQATVVIEAAEKSGSHITARLAAEYGRTVCAVPGSIFNPYSAGTKWLINQGAVLVSSAEDILSEIGLYGSGWVAQQQLDRHKDCSKNSDCGLQLSLEDQVQRQIFELICGRPSSTDDLAEQLDLSAATVNVALSMMELQGVIVREGRLWHSADICQHAV